MIGRVDYRDIFGVKESALTRESEVCLGAFIYILACGQISRDPCWAENRGAKVAVKHTVDFVKASLSISDNDLICSTLNDVFKMFGFSIRRSGDVWQFRTEYVHGYPILYDFKPIYDDPNFAFKKLISGARDRCTHGNFYTSARDTLCEISEMYKRGQTGIDNLAEIVLDFISERDVVVPSHNGVNDILYSIFTTIRA